MLIHVHVAHFMEQSWNIISVDCIVLYLDCLHNFSLLEKDRWMQHSNKRQAKAILEGGRGLDWIIFFIFLHAFSIWGLTVLIHVESVQMQTSLISKPTSTLKCKCCPPFSTPLPPLRWQMASEVRYFNLYTVSETRNSRKSSSLQNNLVLFIVAGVHY